MGWMRGSTPYCTQLGRAHGSAAKSALKYALLHDEKPPEQPADEGSNSKGNCECPADDMKQGRHTALLLRRFCRFDGRRSFLPDKTGVEELGLLINCTEPV